MLGQKYPFHLKKVLVEGKRHYCFQHLCKSALCDGNFEKERALSQIFVIKISPPGKACKLPVMLQTSLFRGSTSGVGLYRSATYKEINSAEETLTSDHTRYYPLYHPHWKHHSAGRPIFHLVTIFGAVTAVLSPPTGVDIFGTAAAFIGTVRVVIHPSPGADSMVILPPRALIRSSMLNSPKPSSTPRRA